MEIREIPDVRARLGKSCLSRSKLWFRHVEKVRPVELLAFVARGKLLGYGEEATWSANTLLTELRRAIGRGDIECCPLESAKMPEAPMTYGEIGKMLAGMTIERRRAVMFSLAGEMPIELVVGLRWKEALKMQHSPIALRVIQSMSRHIRMDFVFWEQRRNSIPMPLIGLSEQLRKASAGMSWDKLAEKYRGAAEIDAYADAEHFESLRKSLIDLT